MRSLKKRTWEILANRDPSDSLCFKINTFILTLIFCNVIAVVLQSVRSLDEAYHPFFFYFEIFSVAIFTFEYFLRLWTCTEDPRYSHPIWGRLQYSFSFMALIDLLAILPSLLLFVQSDLRSIRVIRLVRLFLLAKTGRYNSSIRTLGRVFIAKREELVFSFSLLIFLLISASTLMFFVENEAQPEAFASIPDTMWWAVATLTTVGYGDVAPITGMGRLLGSLVAILGIGLFALPTSILGSAFMEEFEKNRKEKVRCPHCHAHFHPDQIPTDSGKPIS